jgi:hypothetical protein
MDYEEHAKTCEPDDFWGQVKRTVRGEPVSQDQISMIVEAVKKELHPGVLLDLGCGNGALSSYFKCDLGVDSSDYLISIAMNYFGESFETMDVHKYVDWEPDPERFTDILCYGSFMYFKDGEYILRRLYERFKNVKTVYLGNLPDKDRIDLFRTEEFPLDDHTSATGIWRTKKELKSIAGEWEVKFYQMPPEFYAGHYRYDAILRRPS